MKRMQRYPDLSIVLPTLNEAGNLRRLIPEIQETFRERGCLFEVLVVDDASTDGTDRVVEEMFDCYQNVRLLRRCGPRSLSASLFEGFDGARASVIACMDADLAHNPADLAVMVDQLKDCDMVIGSRYLPWKNVAMNGKHPANRMVSRMGGSLIRRLLGLPYCDVTHSFRVFRRSVYCGVKDKVQCQGNAFLVEFLLHAHRQGFKIQEVPIDYGRRVYGKSKLAIFRESIRMLQAVVRLHRERPPLRETF